MGFMDKMKKAAEGVSAQTSKVGVGADRGQMDLANLAKKLMSSGVETPAHIETMTPTGKTDAPGGAEHEITLTVKPVGGDPYEVNINQYIYPQSPYAAGEAVTVRVDPDDANAVMIWGKA